MTRDCEIAEQVLRETAAASFVQRRTVFAFDCANGQFVLLREGWDGYKRVHYAWIHIELQNGKFWIHCDGTEHGIANDLLALGVPKERIVLAFQHQTRRESGEFAVV